MELFTMSSRLTMSEWNALKLVTNETVRLRNQTSFVFFNLIFLRKTVVQNWIKLIDLESRAEIKLIVIFFRRWRSCLSFHRRWPKTKDIKKCKPESFLNFFISDFNSQNTFNHG